MVIRLKTESRACLLDSTSPDLSYTMFSKARPLSADPVMRRVVFMR